jgi:hypothetical protein
VVLRRFSVPFSRTGQFSGAGRGRATALVTLRGYSQPPHKRRLYVGATGTAGVNDNNAKEISTQQLLSTELQTIQRYRRLLQLLRQRFRPGAPHRDIVTREIQRYIRVERQLQRLLMMKNWPIRAVVQVNLAMQAIQYSPDAQAIKDMLQSILDCGIS